MPVSSEYREFIAESLAPLGRISLRRMFSGAGVFQGDLMFGLVTDDTLYFKVDHTNRGDYEAAGTQPFTYAAKGQRRLALGYWQVPDGLLDDPDELCRWARIAVEVALRARAKSKPKASPKAKPKAKAHAASKAAAKPVRPRRARSVAKK